MSKKILQKTAGLFALLLVLVSAAKTQAENIAPAPSPNGIDMPKYYKNWQPIGVSHRPDKNSLRLILGNAIAVQAAKQGKTNPWPDGAIFAKLAWSDQSHPQFPVATVPGELQHVEFMIKDSKKFPATQGWGFARWLGMEQKPYGNDATFVQECFTCHIQAKDSGYVFTRIAPLP